MTVYEADVPGVGKKYELEVGGEERLVVLVHHDGKREVYRRPDPDADSEKLFAVSGDTARKLGSILEGAYFQPVELDEVRVPLGEAIIEWLDVPEGSPLAGQTLEAADIRNELGVSVIAVQRGGETHSNPGPEFTVEAEDILVAIGTREELRALEALLDGSDGGDDGASETGDGDDGGGDPAGATDATDDPEP